MHHQFTWYLHYYLWFSYNPNYPFNHLQCYVTICCKPVCHSQAIVGIMYLPFAKSTNNKFSFHFYIFTLWNYVLHLNISMSDVCYNADIMFFHAFLAIIPWHMLLPIKSTAAYIYDESVAACKFMTFNPSAVIVSRSRGGSCCFLHSFETCDLWDNYSSLFHWKVE